MPTLKEIAQRAGVSAALISAYLNGRASARMRLETKKRIDAALRETGYRPSPLARALRTGKSGIIGYLASSLQNEVSQREMVSFHETLASHGYRMMTRYTKNEYLLFMEGCQELISMGCDGLIVNALSNGEMLEFCKSLSVPAVGISHVPEWSKQDFMITVDYRAGVEEAMRHLIRSGHRKVIFLSHNWERFKTDPRFLVYREFFPQGPCENCPRQELSSTVWLKDILKRHPENSAFFCANDYCAMALKGALDELGFHVPQDFVIIGFDDLPAASLLRLASIRKPLKEMAESAVTLLESKLTQKPFRLPRTLATEFIPRSSCMKQPSEYDSVPKIRGKIHFQPIIGGKK